MLTKSPELKTTNPFDHIDANTTMDATSKRTDTGPHESLVSEAASTLAHLATVAGVMSPSAGTNTAAAAGEGINTSIRIPPLPSIPGSRIEPPAPLSRPDDGKARQAATAEGASVAELIKEAVLRRLSRPEDIVKRNMFAVEGKSIKFPVKVSHCMRVYRFNAIKIATRYFNTAMEPRHGRASVFFNVSFHCFQLTPFFTSFNNGIVVDVSPGRMQRIPKHHFMG